MKIEAKEILIEKFNRQSIGLEDVVNAREMGGIRIGDKTVKHGLLLRTGDLSRMSGKDLMRLEEVFHTSLVFDLRSKYEMGHAPDRAVPGSRYISLPVLDDSGLTSNDMAAFKTFSGENPEMLYFVVKSEHGQTFAKNMYTSFVGNEYTQLQYTTFLEMIIANKEGAVLWHCSQGKDRTGLAGALLLGALGADRETIMGDYYLSSVPYMDFFARLEEGAKGFGCDELAIETMRTFISVNPNYFEAALDMIDNQYGGMHAYLTQVLGLSDQELDILKERYLE